MALPTYGSMAVDWEQRVDFDRLRRERLSRAKALLAKSEMGALLCFDMNNVRYLTSTHIGTWAQDKMSRFSLLPQNDEPILWDFGSAAKHHQLHCPCWESVLGPGFRCCAARCRRRWAARKTSPRKSEWSWKSAVCTKSRSESISLNLPFCSRCSGKESPSSMDSRSCPTRA